MLESLWHYLSIVLVLVLTGMGLPLPEEVPIIAAGVAASTGSLNPWGAFASCLVGALLGDSMLYAIGYHFGHNLVRRHPYLAKLLHAEREAKIEQMIQRHGLKVLLLARFMVGIRAPMYLAAGVLRTGYKRFVAIDTFCAACVVGLFFGLSYYYGDQILKLTDLIRGYEIRFTIVMVVIALVVGVFWWRRSRRRALEATAENGDSLTPSDHENSHADTHSSA